MHEALERVDLDQALEQRLALLVRERLAEGARLDLLAQPHALAVAGDVLDLVRDRAAVGLAQVRQRVGERRARDADAQDARRDLRHQLGRQSSGSGSSAGSPTGLGAERVEARGEVAVRAEGLQQRDGRLDRLQQLLARRRGGGRRRAGAAAAAAAAPAPAAAARQRDAERGEDALVEVVLALQVALDQLQEAPRLGALDDAMVVRRGHRHDLLGADLRADRAEPDRVGDRAGRDDRALADHQPRHGGDVPIPPGFVSVMLPPTRSSAVSVFVRAFSTSAS